MDECKEKATFEPSFVRVVVLNQSLNQSPVFGTIGYVVHRGVAAYGSQARGHRPTVRLVCVKTTRGGRLVPIWGQLH